MDCNNPVLVEKIQGEPVVLKDQHPPRISAAERRLAIRSAQKAAADTAQSHCEMGTCIDPIGNELEKLTGCTALPDPAFTAVIAVEVILENQAYCARATYTMRYTCECVALMPGKNWKFFLKPFHLPIPPTPKLPEDSPPKVPPAYDTLGPGPGMLDGHDTISGPDGSDDLLLIDPPAPAPAPKPPAKAPKGKGGKGAAPSKPRRR
jgi:hypothetical protein